MGIVLNEYEWSRDMIERRSLGKNAYETLSRIAGYYMCDGYGRKAVRQKLEEFVMYCNPSASIPLWDDIIEGALSRASKYGIIRLDRIPITEKEMSVVLGIDRVQERRLAFTLLCIAKYWNAVNSKNSGWVNCSDGEIMSLANINTSVKRRCSMYRSLRDVGLIQFSKRVDGTNIRVCFVDPEESDSKIAVSIVDFRNVGYQLLKYCGEPFFECEHCGITTKMRTPSKGRRQKYCDSCAVEVRTQQNVNSVMKLRNGA